jgi:hypothetical protein
VWITLVVWIVIRAAACKNRWQIRQTQAIGNQTTACRYVDPEIWTCGAKSKRSMPLTRYDDGWNPVPMRRSPGSGVAIKNSARLINGRRSRADGYAQLVPTHGIAIRIRVSGGDAVSINRNIMRCPQPSISDVRRKQSIIERIQPDAARNCLHAAAVGIRCARDWERCRVYSDRDICRNAWSAAGTADSAHDQAAKGRVARTDDVAFGGVWVVVINTAGAIGAVAPRNESAEGGDNDWPASHDRSFLNNVDVGVVKIPARRVEHIAAHVESVGVDTERVVVEKLVRVSVADGILLDREKRPHRAIADNPVAGRVRNRNQDAVRLVSDAARRAARNVDHR